MDTNTQAPYAIHWFRRDLRLEGNELLQAQLKKYQGRVLTVFCFDHRFLGRADFSAHRFLFFLKTLEQLKTQIESLGGVFVFLDQGPSEAFPLLLEACKKEWGSLPKDFAWNRDYEPYALARDHQIEDRCRSEWMINPVTARDHLLIEPHELKKDGTAGGFYQIYTPFKNRWLKLFETPEIQKRIHAIKASLKQKPESFSLKVSKNNAIINSDLLAVYLKKVSTQVAMPIPKVGFAHAFAQALHFKSKKHQDYKINRDFPTIAGTSQLSIYFKNGTITPPQVMAAFSLESGGPKNNDTYFNELIWREFYYHILSHCPYVEHGSFIKKYDALQWENNPEYFEAWKNGTTGYPIVDAGMRQLKETGWMHNRVRMIVASFLTKDLLIDWRWGERYFMNALLDGDLAPNNGGWQWAASTGCDAQPYFRIFNPVLQGERFDPDGEYCVRFVPELKSSKGTKDFHEPKNPIIEHAIQKEKVLEIFRKVQVK